MGAPQGASLPCLQASLASSMHKAAHCLEWPSSARLKGTCSFSQQGPGRSRSQAAAKAGSPRCPLTSTPGGCVLGAGTQGDNVAPDTTDISRVTVLDAHGGDNARTKLPPCAGKGLSRKPNHTPLGENQRPHLRLLQHGTQPSP